MTMTLIYYIIVNEMLLYNCDKKNQTYDNELEKNNYVKIDLMRILKTISNIIE